MIFALAGNQNCGKTTLFNQLTGANQHVGNFPGVTVDRKDGRIRGHAEAVVTDLPGIYSLSPYSSEEVVTRQFLLEERPRGIINIVVSNLVLGVDKTNWPVMLVLGVVNAALYFFLFTFLIKKLNLHTPGREEESELAESVAEGEAAASVAVKQGAVAAAPAEGVDAGIADLVAGLGGKDNIEELENCFTRLRVNVKNPDLINEDLINHVPNSGINRNGNNIQIIFGMKVAEMRDKVENAIEKEQ